MATKDITRYTEAVGRRKTSTARARITPASKQEVVVNGKPVADYFPTDTMRTIAVSPFHIEGLEQKFTVTVKVTGGGICSQSGAVRHAIARALTAFEETLRKPLKVEGYLKRDPRMKERRKFGLKKARRAPQWSKR
ncbi:MAG: 30S ribosomal protein S9 [Candidatus Pacebacteria bacterium]|nr:30S ribosomal protein S9 [Candidatus Paceibacterota bacterium]